MVEKRHALVYRKNVLFYDNMNNKGKHFATQLVCSKIPAILIATCTLPFLIAVFHIDVENFLPNQEFVDYFHASQPDEFYSKV